MKKINFNFKECASEVSAFILLFLITFSLIINPIAAIAASGTTVVGSSGASENEVAPIGSETSSNADGSFAPSTVFTNSTLITVPDNTGAQASASSAISVSGLSGPISSVAVTLNNINANNSRDLDFLLVGPGGQKFSFMSDVGGNTATTGATITLSDAGAALLTQTGAIPSGTFKPTNFTVESYANAAAGSLPAPAPAGPYNEAAPLGAATFTSVFGGLSAANVNGNWTLYVADDTSTAANATINGGWSIDVVTTPAASATTTTISSSLNPSNTNQAVTFTATVTSSTTVNTGTVTFTDSTTGATLCNNVNVNASGVATCLVPANTLSERVHTITATYNGNATFSTSNASLQQTVNTPTQQSGNTFTNPGGITIADNVGGASSVPYPSNLTVSGLTGSISKVTLSLNVNFPNTGDVDLLLVGPGGQTYVFWSDAGGATSASSGVITLDDTAATQLPASGSIAAGTYRPADYATNTDSFPSPAPAAPYNSAPPAGAATFASVFGGTAPNGIWKLYATDDLGSGAVNQTISSWSLTFTTSGDATTTTTLTSSPNPSAPNQAILLTATVTSTSTVNTGTVTFRNGGTVLCANVTVNASGVATCNVPANTFAQGDYVLTADYNGVAGQFNISSGSTTQNVISPTVVTGNNFANNGGITIPNSSIGNPYPSRINVTGLSGTISKVTVSLNGINAPNPDHVDFLLVSPTGQKFLFLGDAGGTNAITGVNITLDDDAATQIPDSTIITSGTYRPGSYTGGDTFPAPAPSAPYNPAASEGTGTFALFNGTNPNGQWQLFTVEDTGDAQNTTLSGWSLTFTLTPAPTTTTVTSSVNPSVFGQPVTFTATVTSAGGTPTGTVQFFDGATPIGAAQTLNASGVATVTTSALSVGTHVITAQYSGAIGTGGGGFGASTGTLAGGQVVNQANATVSVASSNNPSVFGQSVTLTATVAATSPGAGTPTGTVTFLDGGNPIAGCSNVMLNAGQAQCITAALSVGSHTITVQYSGNTNFSASAGTLAGGQVVNKANSVVGITSSANPSVFGQSINLTATVGPVSPGAGTPTGTVSFLDGGNAIAGCTNLALTAGQAVCATSALGVGNHTITAQYSGDTNFNTSTGSLTGNPQVVNKANTSISITSSANPSVFGQPVTFTATISVVAPGAGTPSGTISFLDGGNPISGCTNVAIVGGQAQCAAANLSTGNHTITAQYSGDTNFNTSTGSLTGNPQVVNKANTSVSLTSSQNPSVFGQSVTFTASISVTAPGAGTPTGTISFLDGGNAISGCTGVAITAGQAVCTTASLSTGNHTITAQYSGDTNFNTSTGSLTGNPQVVNKANTSVNLTSSLNPSILGQAVTFTATISVVAPGAGTPSGTVQFLDNGNPIAGCTSVAISGGQAQCTTSSLTAGNHTITAQYSGDTNFNTSTGSLTGNPQVVNAPTVSIGDVRIAEGNSGTTTATFTLTAAGNASTAISVQYSTGGGTATAGSDYVAATNQTVNFTAGQSTQTITVTINGDLLKEANETFFVNLSSPTNATITDNQGVGIIIDEDRAYVSDFDRDLQSDLTVFRPSNSFWYSLQSTNDLPSSTFFGADGDIPVPGDYDADGRTDLAVWRPSNGAWYIQQSSNFAFVARQWGISTDIPVQGDYDGDNKTDSAVYRNGIFYVFRSTDNTGTGVYFGASGDIPVQSDYDGDHRTDYAVFRPSNGFWYILSSATNTTSAVQFGQNGDVPVTGDFDGDGKTDQAVYRSGVWYILQSLTNTVRSVAFGVATDIPTPADYDADGTTDIGVFRPAGGIWYSIDSSTGNFRSRQFGQNGDVPIPAAY